MLAHVAAGSAATGAAPSGLWIAAAASLCYLIGLRKTAGSRNDDPTRETPFQANHRKTSNSRCDMTLAMLVLNGTASPWGAAASPEGRW
jgi:hypothetical protein